MDLGKRRRLRRQRQRKKHGTTAVPGREGNSPAFIAFAILVAGAQTAAIWYDEIASALSQAYCTPDFCLALPQVLTGWAIAVAPLPVYLWNRHAALYTGMFLVGLMGTFFITANQGGSDLWLLPLSYFLVGLLFVPISVGISRLAKPGWRAVVVAGQHWLLLAGLILWLA